MKTTTKDGAGVYRYRHAYDRRNQRTERLAEGAGKSWTSMQYDDEGRLVRAAGYAYAFDAHGRCAPGRDSATTPGKIEFLNRDRRL